SRSRLGASSTRGVAAASRCERALRCRRRPGCILAAEGDPGMSRGAPWRKGSRMETERFRIAVYRSSWALLWALAAAAGAPSLPRAPLSPTPDPKFKKGEVVEPSGMTEAPPGPLRLMPGDALDMKTLSRMPLDAPNLIVDPGGGVHVPLVGRIRVAGMSLREAELAIEKEVQLIDRFARVALTLRAQTVYPHQAAVIGAVDKPTRVPVQGELRLVDLLAAAGGPKTFKSTIVEGEEYDLADLAAARLIRAGKPLPVSVLRAMQGDTRHNVRV